MNELFLFVEGDVESHTVDDDTRRGPNPRWIHILAGKDKSRTSPLEIGMGTTNSRHGTVRLRTQCLPIIVGAASEGLLATPVAVVVRTEEEFELIKR